MFPLSPTVYGDWEGEWVDEGSELRAAGGKGWSRVMAEHEVRRWLRNSAAMLLFCKCC